MTGNPRIQIALPADLFDRAHARARELGITTSAWLRGLLRTTGGKTPIPPTRQLSVRLDPWHLQRLDQLAQRSGISRSRAFARLITRALASGDSPRPTPHAAPEVDTPAIPAPDAYTQWAGLILEAAMDTPHKFYERKAFISGVLDELERRLRPRDPMAFRDMLRTMLPELNRLDLVPLARADLVPVMDTAQVAASEITHGRATFHFVDLTRYLPDPWRQP